MTVDHWSWYHRVPTHLPVIRFYDEGLSIGLLFEYQLTSAVCRKLNKDWSRVGGQARPESMYTIDVPFDNGRGHSQLFVDETRSYGDDVFVCVFLSSAYILATAPVYDPTELSRANRVATVQRPLRRLSHVHCHDPIQT